MSKNKSTPVVSTIFLQISVSPLFLNINPVRKSWLVPSTFVLIVFITAEIICSASETFVLSILPFNSGEFAPFSLSSSSPESKNSLHHTNRPQQQFEHRTEFPLP